jgi:ABC-2 type transport system ATP-binding protein
VTPAITTFGLTKDYGAGHGVFDLTLEVHRGEVFGFLGPNGAGKSTTMRLLLDLIRPTAGRAAVLGHDVREDGIATRGLIGFLPGDLRLPSKLRGRDVLDHLAALRGGVDPAVRDALIDRFDAQVDRPVGDLSTGNRQKLGLIQAFMHQPELLILDEPITGLDPLVQQEFHRLLREVAADGRTVFLSSHTLSEVERVADRVAILRDGRLVSLDSVNHLRDIAVRRLEVELDDEAPVGELRGVPGVYDVSCEGGRIVIAYEGAPDALVKALAGHRVSALRTRDDDLEHIFLGYYRGDGGRSR